MAFATAGPNEYLVIGKKGKVTSLGTGIQTFLWPGSTFVLIPSTKQEATFEMTQETKDGIPVRFKGIVIYRIIDPVTASMNFDFRSRNGLDEINALINNICLGELRATVSGMTMQECIEQRKTILTAAVDRSLREVVASQNENPGAKWGIELELVQVAQVFVVDPGLRKQLEAQVRNEIRSQSDRSDIQTQQEIELARMASDSTLREQKLQVEKEKIRQGEELDQATLQVRSRAQKQQTDIEKEAIQLAADKFKIELAIAKEKEEADFQVRSRQQKQIQQIEKEAILLAAEKFKLEMDTAKEKEEAENPVKLLQVENQRAVLEQELEMRRLEALVREQVVKSSMMMETAKQTLRKEILPIEQTPEVAMALADIFKDARFSFVGSENQLLASILPLIQAVSDTVKGSLPNSNN